METFYACPLVFIMKRNIRVYDKGKYVDKEISYIPVRYIIDILITIIEIASVMQLCFY